MTYPYDYITRWTIWGPSTQPHVKMDAHLVHWVLGCSALHLAHLAMARKRKHWFFCVVSRIKIPHKASSKLVNL